MLHRVMKRWVLVALAGCLALTGCFRASETTAQPTAPPTIAHPFDSPTATARPSVTAKPTARPSATGTSALAPAAPLTDLPTIGVSQLPAQAVTTLRLIAAGGPYPYRRDGATFGNQERLLPRHPYGFYTEYTVITPGSSDRGARRIVAGRDGSRFYTDDHYNSFSEVVDQ